MVNLSTCWAISGRTRASQAELREAQLTKKINKVQEACRKKLEEVHNGYVQVSKASPLLLQGFDYSWCSTNTAAAGYMGSATQSMANNAGFAGTSVDCLNPLPRLRLQAKRKYEEAMRVNQTLKQDADELQNKYAQKAQ